MMEMDRLEEAIFSGYTNVNSEQKTCKVLHIVEISREAFCQYLYHGKYCHCENSMLF